MAPFGMSDQAAKGLFALRFGPRLASHILRQRRRHEPVEIAIEHPCGIRGFNIGAQVFHHLIGLQNVGSDLIAPAGITLIFVLGVDGGIALVKFQLVEPRFQRRHTVGPVLMLRFLRTCHHDIGGQMGDPDSAVGGVDVLAARARGSVGVDPDITVGNVDLDIVIDHRINPVG